MKTALVFGSSGLIGGHLLYQLIENNNYQTIINWLKKNVHCHGRSLNAMELVKKISGNELSSNYFLNYLKQKIDQLN